MKTAICDDNIIFQTKLKDQLRAVPFFESSDFLCFQSGKELLDAKQIFDFAFMDVDMPEMNGLDAAKLLHDLSPETVIVFVSSYSQYAVDAFDCNAVGYLLKGSDEEKFVRTIERAVAAYKNIKAQILLNTGSGTVCVSPEQILYIEYARKYCTYYTVDRAAYSVRRSLQDALSELELLGFVQIYQCFAVNMSKIQEIRSADILLTNGIKLPIKRGSSKDLIKAYTRFIYGRL